MSFINYLNNIITYFGSFMGPIFAISVVDYFIIRHREYTLEDLYWSKGKYRYDKGFSLAAIYSMLIGFGVGCILSSFMYFASILGAGYRLLFPDDQMVSEEASGSGRPAVTFRRLIRSAPANGRPAK